MGALGARAVVCRGAVPDGGRVSAEPHPVQLLAFELSGRRLAVPIEDLDTVVDLEAVLSSEGEARLDAAREAVAAGVVDLELPITEIGQRLAALVGRGK